jgi:serine protease AprX
MRRHAFFAFVLVIMLFGTLSFSINAYSKESTPVEEQEVKTVKSNKDSDKNKIVDALDEELKGKSDDYKRDVIALIKLDGQAKGKVKVLEKVLGELNIKDVYSIIPGFSAKMSKKQIKALAALSDTIQIEPDLEVHAFLDKSTTWFGVQNARSDFNVDGNADGNPATYSKDDVVVAVIDTGICANHQDLDSSKVIGWKDYVNNQVAPYDDNGHGCHVASIAAGEGQANPAYTGVAPGAALVGVKVLNSAGSGFTSTVVSGVNWVVQNKALYGIEIMNLSLGSSGCSNGSDSLSVAINNAVSNGIVAVVAAGNSGPKTCTIGSPAAAQNAITVGAMADVGELGFSIASFSSRGPTSDNRIKPDVVAPGVSITAASRTSTTGYVTYSGTSMATPFVAGVAALMLDANSSLIPSDVKNKIMNTSIDWGPTGIDVDYGAGRLDGYDAVNDASVASLGNVAVPVHTFISDSLGGTGSTDIWNINVLDTTYPISVAMIMTSWSSSSSPDFDMELYSPANTLIAISDGTTRQETIKVPVSATGIYTLEVYSYTGSGPYFVDISAGSGPPPPPNNPPVADDDSAVTDEDNSVIVNVLEGDNDPDLDTLTVTSVSTPSKGSATKNGDGTISYSPNPNANGADSFTYTISDGKGGTDTGSVSITINAVNDAPVANDQSVITTKDTQVVIILTGSDVDGPAPTYSVVAEPTNGVLSGDAPNLTYTPNTNFVGFDSFTFKASDGSLDSDIATVNITVNPPVEQIFSDGFTNFSQWTESNEFDWNVERFAERNIPGYTSTNLVAHADRCSSSAGCILTMANSLDLSGYQNATLTFWRYVDNDLDNNEFLRLQIFDGTSWITIFSWTNKSGDDDTWHQETVDLSGYLNSGFTLRFVSKQSSSSEDTEIDDVMISGVPEI